MMLTRTRLGSLCSTALTKIPKNTPQHKSMNATFTYISKIGIDIKYNVCTLHDNHCTATDNLLIKTTHLD